MTPKSLFMVTDVLFYFLYAIWCPEHTILRNQLSIADFTIVAKVSLFWFGIVMPPWSTSCECQHYHCDFIFVDYSCMCKLVQRRSSLVNNSREYWYLTTQYSWLSMQEILITVCLCNSYLEKMETHFAQSHWQFWIKLQQYKFRIVTIIL